MAPRPVPHVHDQPYTEGRGLTVGELRTALLAVPDDVEVVMSKDAEGNGFSPLGDVSARMYVRERPWSGQTYMSDAELDSRVRGGEVGWSEDDRAPDDAYPVIELGPVN